MAPTHTSKSKSKPLRRTVELPASLRQELQDLGHIPKPGKGKLGRKEKRKAAREGVKGARAAHFSGGEGGKKRKSEEEEEEVPQQGGKRAKPNPTPAAADVAEPETAAPPPPAPKPHQTPLERLLAKQESRSSPAASKKKKKNPAESAEDLEIAWLEAKLGVRGGDPALKDKEGGMWKGEMRDDGLDELFGGLEELESAAFGSSSKEYARLLREQEADSDASSTSEDDDDEQDLDGALDDLEFGGGGAGSDDSAFGENGISDDELLDPSDDDDHDEMGELGSEGETGDEEAEFDAEGLEGWESDGEGGGMTMTFPAEPVEEAAPAPAAPAPAPAPTPKAGAYIPPHLRATVSTPIAPPTTASLASQPPVDPRLRRVLLGHLNKLSSTNLPIILAALETLYASNPRAVVSATLTEIMLEMISGRDDLGESLVVSYAALVAALAKSVGVEFGAGVVARCVELFDAALERNIVARQEGGGRVAGEGEGEGFQGRPGSKECLNLVAFLAELYNFQVVACLLIYDLVRLFVDSGLEELEVELLVKVVKRSGQQLRQDDPSALKEIINLVKAKQQGVDQGSMNSRTRFMLDALTNLKNNKTQKPDANGAAVDHYSGLRKFLSGLRKRGGSTPDALRISLSDLRSSSTKGKWWLVGAAWGGDPLLDAGPGITMKDVSASTSTSDAKMAKLARVQGMNTDIRKAVFEVLMTSEDYVDACERLLQLGLSDVQQREIARILLQCCGNEKAYNPYYTLVAHRMGTKSHGFTITLQYCLWDFLRELGEKKVGGEEMVKQLDEEAARVTTTSKVSPRRVTNLAKLYAWGVAKDVLGLTILKPIPFGNPKPTTLSFLTQFFTSLLLASQTTSPALVLPKTITRKDKEAIERIFIKVAPHGQLVKGLGYFFETAMDDEFEGSKEGRGLGAREIKLIKWGCKVAKETLSSSSGIVVDLR